MPPTYSALFLREFPEVAGGSQPSDPAKDIQNILTGKVPFFGDTVNYAESPGTQPAWPGSAAAMGANAINNAPYIGQLIGTALMPNKAPFAAAVGRTLLGGAGSAAGAAVRGDELGGVKQEGLMGLLTQGLGEAAPAALRYGVLNPAKAAVARSEYAQTLIKKAAEYADMLKQNKAIAAFPGAVNNAIAQLKKLGLGDEAATLEQAWESQTRAAKFNAAREGGLQKQAYEEGLATSTQRHAEYVSAQHSARADQLVGQMDQQVPAWRGLKGGPEGIRERVVGEGQKRASDAYEAAMQAALVKGEGQMVPISFKAAKSLGVPADKIEVIGQKTAKSAGDDLEHGMVDASALLQAMTGKSLKPGYREAAAALDAAGIGDPVARSEYRAAMGFMDFIDKTKAIKGNTVDMEKLAGGLDVRKTVDLLRRRGLGTGTAGPLRDVTENLPPRELAMVPEPGKAVPLKRIEDMPRFDMGTPPDIGILNTGDRSTRAKVGALIGGLLGGGGHWSPYSMGTGAGLGALAGGMLPNQIITRAPLSPEIEYALRDSPNLIGAILRTYLGGQE